ncbi:FAS-associated death domain protein [Notolabrus celidotus]|uniref:FAS-associated death domain protein n=1 Tax=Notolabrus celidotus TaxID=1203425 RepID=UPI00148FB97E|nr:FAS-associated death domain protein [Notolabrus celidotus]
MSSLQFNSVLLEISNSLSPDQLEQIKYLCHNDIGKKYLETIDSGWKLFQFLKEKLKLGEDNTDYVCQLLEKVRPDLSERLRNFDCQPENNENLPSEPERAKLDIATEMIVESLGRNWRKLGRKLGLSDTKLESISRRHPTELEETAVELLKEWRKSRGAEARTDDVITALRACNFNLTADKIEDKLSKLTCQ